MEEFNYDIGELRKLGEPLNDGFGYFTKVVKLTFCDRGYNRTFYVDIGGNIVGYDVLDFALDEVLEQHNFHLEFYDDDDVLLVEDRIQLERMLVCFQIIGVLKPRVMCKGYITK